MSKTRRNFTADQKADVVRRHLRDRVAVGDLAAELDIQPSLIHQWVAAVLAQADKAFVRTPPVAGDLLDKMVDFDFLATGRFFRTRITPLANKAAMSLCLAPLLTIYLL